MQHDTLPGQREACDSRSEGLRFRQRSQSRPEHLGVSDGDLSHFWWGVITTPASNIQPCSWQYIVIAITPWHSSREPGALCSAGKSNIALLALTLPNLSALLVGSTSIRTHDPCRALRFSRASIPSFSPIFATTAAAKWPQSERKVYITCTLWNWS